MLGFFVFLYMLYGIIMVYEYIQDIINFIIFSTSNRFCRSIIYESEEGFCTTE